MAKKLKPRTIYKVRVVLKNPVDRKSVIMGINGYTIDFYRESREVSPYKNITVLGEYR